MSYILDALKKSETERKTDATPSLYTQHGPIPGGSSNRKNKKRFIFLTIVLLLGINTLLLFLLLQSPPLSPPNRINASMEDIPQTNNNHLEPVIIDTHNLNEKTVDNPTSIVENPKTFTQEETPRLINADELPEDLKRSLPVLNISGHTYSQDPRRRIILINNRILREGDFVEQGLQLKEITWTGVVLDFQGTLFTISVE